MQQCNKSGSWQDAVQKNSIALSELTIALVELTAFEAIRARKCFFSAGQLMPRIWVGDASARLQRQDRKGRSFSHHLLANFTFFPHAFSAFSSVTQRPLLFSYRKSENLCNLCSVSLTERQNWQGSRG